ncbi:MAG: penicillin-binding protein, partial [Myxococcales bacterium]|nr:penicillin-binding protein [Myxococcales bacterium]
MRSIDRARAALYLLVFGAVVVLPGGIGASPPAAGDEGTMHARGGKGAESNKPDGGLRAPDLRGVDPRKMERDGETMHVALPGRRDARLTVDAGLQEHIERELRKNAVPRAGVVALDPRTGRVLAYVSRDTGEFGPAVDVARDASAPAASVFKVVTASALVDAGVGPKRTACYHGGLHGLTKDDIVDGPRDHRCDSLSDALARSLNAVFAKLSLGHLDQKSLTARARAFGFGAAPGFELPVAKSALDVPDPAKDRLEFGKLSAGFFHTTMSPIHGALIAATVANRGRMPTPQLIESVRDAEGRAVYTAPAPSSHEVIGAQTARTVGRMMEGTVAFGTARSAFLDDKGWAFLPDIKVAGKTGTLSDAKPYRGYTWWVGYAPADDPQIAVASLVVNTPLWR